MSDLPTFSRRIKLRAEDIGRNVNAAVKAAALAVDQAVVLGTPVDTGRARSNWQVSRLAPRSDELPPYAPGSRLGKGERANAQAAINQGELVIRGRRLGEDVYITNNTPYIGDLNSGTSRQAPAQFVEIAVQEALQAVRARRILGAR